jgi:DNA-binding response OmpR family regulator
LHDSRVGPQSSEWSIVLVDDAPEMGELFSEIFREANVKLLLAESVDEARTLLSAHDPVAVFIDVILHGRPDGLALCRELAETDDRQGLMRVVISGLTSPADVDAARKVGADAYLLKPFSPTQVLAIVDAAVAWKISGRGRPHHLWPFGPMR